MQTVAINYFALIGATLAKGALGFVWYSPALFLRPWLQRTGLTRESMNVGLATALTVETLGNLVMAYVLAHGIHYAGATGPLEGALVGAWNWLGFVAVVMLVSAAYEKRPYSLAAINGGYQLLGLLLMGAIIGAWGTT